MKPKFDSRGLIPCIAQDADSGEVLMLAYMNRASFEKTRRSGYAHYFSRSRQKLWKKGETSGHVQKIKSIHLDCDADAVLIQVEQTGPACHTGKPACFFRPLSGVRAPRAESLGAVLARLDKVLASRLKLRPKGSYTVEVTTSRRGKTGLDRVLEKIGEEATELVLAVKNGKKRRVVEEACDLLFHTVLLMRLTGVDLWDLSKELTRRAR